MDFLFVFWNGYVDNGLDGNWVGLKVIGGNDVVYEYCFLYEEFYFVEVQFDMMLFKVFKYSNEVVVMVDFGFCICSVIFWNQDVIGDVDYLEVFKDYMDLVLLFFRC